MVLSVVSSTKCRKNMNSSLWRNNHKLNKILGERLTHARSTNDQQIVNAAPDVTSLVFPAIGAILILVFGGFLLSSTNSCCISASEKKRNKRHYNNEEINFTSIYDSVSLRLAPVLQQENNDVVDAVMETYRDLPQYAPVNDLVAAIPVMKSDNIAINKPETKDACLSPMHEINSLKIPENIRNHGNEITILEDEAILQKSCSELNERFSDDERSEGQGPGRSQSSGIGSCFSDRSFICSSSMDNPTAHDLSCNRLPRGNSASSGLIHYKNIPKEALSLCDQLTINTSRDNMRLNPIGQVRCKKECCPISGSSSCVNGSTAEDEGISSSQLNQLEIEKFEIEKFVGQVVPKHDEANTSYKWKRPAKLSKKDKLQILKCLQPRIESDTAYKSRNKKQLDEENNNENYTNQSLKGSKAGTAERVNDVQRTNNVKGGRLSRLNVVRAPSGLCVHGNRCHAHCKIGHVTSCPEEIDCHLNDSGRGASCFADSFRESLSSLRGASVFVDPVRGASSFAESRDSISSKLDNNNLPGPDHINSARGTSSFGGKTETYTGNKGVALDDAVRTYGQVTNSWLTQGVNEQSTNDMRGASTFGKSCDRLSVTGTASITLSMAVQSEKEGFSDDSDSLENSITVKQLCVAGKQLETTLEDKEGVVQEQNQDKTIIDDEKEKEYRLSYNNKENNCFVEKPDVIKQNTLEQRMENTCVYSDTSVKEVDTRRDNIDVETTSLSQSVEWPLEENSTIKKRTMGVLKSEDKISLEEDEPNRCSSPNVIVETRQDPVIPCTVEPQMSLGKNTRVLSGLLKALQREKRKGNCKTINYDKEIGLPSLSAHDVPSIENAAERGSDELRRPIVGKIKVCLFYTRSDTSNPVLYVTVLKAYSLRHQYVTPKEDFYVEMDMSTRDNSKDKTTSVKEYKNSVVFNHLFNVPSIKTRELEISELKLMLVSGRSNERVGIAILPLAELVSRDKIKKTYLLRRAGSEKYSIPVGEPLPRTPVGAVYLGMKYNSVEEKLLVHVIKVRGLPAVSETGETDPYLMVTVKDDGKTIEEKMTATKWNQRNPVFDFKHVFELNNIRIQSSSLVLRVMNNSANHSLIGTVKLGMDSEEESGLCHWNNVITKPGVLEERWHKLLNEESDKNNSKSNH